MITNLLSDRLLLRARAKRGGRHKIEDRLTVNLWPCGLILMPFGVLLFGWGIGSGMTYWTGIIGFGIQVYILYVQHYDKATVCSHYRTEPRDESIHDFH